AATIRAEAFMAQILWSREQGFRGKLRGQAHPRRARHAGRSRIAGIFLADLFPLQAHRSRVPGPVAARTAPAESYEYRCASCVAALERMRSAAEAAAAGCRRRCRSESATTHARITATMSSSTVSGLSWRVKYPVMRPKAGGSRE